MAESTLRHHTVEGYPLRGERATVLCYRLICGLLASPRLAQLAAAPLDDPISMLRDEYELSEAAHHLVEIAIYCRTAQDKYLKLCHLNIDWLSNSVGTLKSPAASRKKEILTFREACHKLIHAEDITWEVVNERGGYKRSLRPVVYLHGTKQKKQWRASLDVILFVKEAYSLLRMV